MIYQLNKRYFVRPLRESDVDGPYPGWFEDQEVCQYNTHGKFFKNKDYFRDYIRDMNREDRVVWAVCHSKDGHVGNIALHGISFTNRHAEFAILLGDKRHWGKGVGLLAGRKILEHGFEKLDLQRIYCGTAATNAGMKKLAVSLGMTLESTRRGQLFLEGKRVDAIEYAILQSEFRGRPSR